LSRVIEEEILGFLGIEQAKDMPGSTTSTSRIQQG
jgi:hypothetical protein